MDQNEASSKPNELEALVGLVLLSVELSHPAVIVRRPVVWGSTTPLVMTCLAGVFGVRRQFNFEIILSFAVTCFLAFQLD